jgi:polyisoprenoid-binding protein YceI
MRSRAVWTGALAAAAWLVAASAGAQTDIWNIDANHTSAQFAVRHMMVTMVRGSLGKVTGSVHWDGKDVRTVVADVAIDVAGLNSGVGRRDDHLRGADFFDVARHPTITFKSKRVAAGSNGRFQLAGDLTIRSTTREVTLDVEGPIAPVKAGNNLRTGATAAAKIDRKDFGLLWNRAIEGGGITVGDEVTITIDIELTRPAAPAT